MLTLLTSKLRRRAAITLAVLYSLFAMMPPVALAAVNSLTTPSIFGENHNKTRVHLHTDGISHDHSDHGAPHEHPGHADGKATNCCGLFSLSAIGADVEVLLDRESRGRILVALADAGVKDRSPDRLYRPPISSPLSF